LLGQVGELLSGNDISLQDLDAIVWGRGPGMFTGLRIGAGIVQGLAYAANRPVVCVSSLAVLAQAHCHEPFNIVAAIDARMGQVYWATYRAGNSIVESVHDERVSDPGNLGDWVEGACIGVGSGWDQYHDKLSAAMGDKLERWIPGQHPGGNALLSLGEEYFRNGKSVKAFDALPVYVRDDVAKKSIDQNSRGK